MNFLFIINDPPYGTERAYNGLRHANAVAVDNQTAIKIFLIADAAACAKAGQKTPNGFYNIEKMLKIANRKGIEIGVCGSCMDARGLKDADLIECATRSSMAQLTEWTMWADKVVTY